MRDKKFNIEVYPAHRGDCILVHCDNGNETTNILIDTGFASTFEVLKKRIQKNKTLPEIKKIDLFVVTHIDADHIAGGLNFLNENGSSLSPKIIQIDNIWHNSYRHLFNTQVKPQEFSEEQLGIIKAVKKEVFKNDTFKNEFKGGQISAKQGSSVGELILKNGYCWNSHSENKAVSVENCPNKIMINDVAITILSPNSDKLSKLKKEWKNELVKAGVVNKNETETYIDDAFEFFKLKNREIIKKAGFNISSKCKSIDASLAEYLDIDEDNSANNGSSIAFILEFADKKALFLGDAHPSLIAKQIFDTYKHKPVKFDFIKVSHHGSKKNMLFKDKDEICNLSDFIVAEKYLISTNGKRHNHPDSYTISQIVNSNREVKKQLFFNYETTTSKCFAKKEEWKKEYNYSTKYIDYKTPIKLFDNE